MGKVVKKIGGFIGAVVVSAIGVALAPVTGGASLVIGGKLATGLFLGNIASLATSLIAPKPAGFGGADARGTAFADPEAPGAFVFGETAAPMAAVFEQNHGTDKELLTDVFAHAWHEIDSYIALHVDSEQVTFSGEAATGDFAGILTWKRNPGAQTQAALVLSGTVWPSTAAGKGVAHSALIWNFKNQDKLKGGVPNRIVCRVRGAKLYDPRLDSTAGGSGTQRYNDPSTWAWNDGNAALVALRYLIGEKSAGGKLIWGVGEAQGDIDLASFMTAANIADELRDGVPRHRLGGVFETSNDHESFFRQWETNTGGKISRIGGKRFCWLPNDDLIPLATITDADILGDGGVEYVAGGDIAGLYNTARGRFISPAELYQAAVYPEVEESQAVADDGKSRILDLDFSWVQDIASAERIARLQVRRSRFQRVWRIVMGWRGFLYAPFDILKLNCQETNFQDQLVRVVDMQMSANGAVALTLQEEDASIYDETLPLGTPPAVNTIPDRLDRLGTLTPRYIDGQAIDDLMPSEGGAQANPRDPLNLWRDPNFEDGTAIWIAKDPEHSLVADPLGIFLNVVQMTPTGGINTSNLMFAPCAPGEAFYTEEWLLKDGSVNAGASLGFVFTWYDKNDSVITFSSDLRSESALSTTSWTKFAKTITAPANAVKVRVAIDNRESHTSGLLFFANPRIFRAVDLSQSQVLNKTADHIAESGSRKWAAEAGANITETRIAAGISGQGSLATKNAANLDSEVTDGLTYQRVKATALTTGEVDFAKAGVRNKTADYVAESGSRKWAAESGANITETRIAAGISGQGSLATKNAANLDSEVTDGTTYRRATVNEATGGGRAYSALINNSRLARAVTKEQAPGGTGREVPIGGAAIGVFDGAPVNFSDPWNAPPLIRFEGGISYNSAFTGSQEQVYSAQNLSTSGFTPSLKIKAIGTSVPQTESPFVLTGGTPAYQIEKNIAAEDKNDIYTFNLDVTVPDCQQPVGEPQEGSITLGLYTRTVAAGAWTLRSSITITTTGLVQAPVSVPGLGVDAAFGVHIMDSGRCNVAAPPVFNAGASSVSYDTGTTGGESTATPAGAAAVRSFVIGNQQQV